MPYRNQSGFTLIELVISIGLAGIVLLVLISSLLLMISFRVKNQSIAEVEQQGAFVMELVSRTLRNAEAITSPTAGNTASSLTVDVVDVASDPTVFDLSSSRVRMTEGVGSPIFLTSSLLNASSITFRNLTRTNTPGALRIELTLSRVNTSGWFPFSFSKTFYGTAALRPQ